MQTNNLPEPAPEVNPPDSFRRRINHRDQCIIDGGIPLNWEQMLTDGAARFAEFSAKLAANCHRQLVYDVFTNEPAGVDLDAPPVKHALHCGLVSAIGALVQWDINAARRLCAQILEDVNDHGEAAIMYRKAEGVEL